MENGIRFDLEYETMPWHRVDAVVFDIGNILIRYAPKDFLEQLFPGDAQKQQDMLARVYKGPYWERFDRGEMEYAEAARRLAGQFGGDEAEYMRALTGWIELKTPIDEGFRAAQRCRRAGKRLYLLSNYPREGYQRMREKFADRFGELFDGGVISYAYEVKARVLGVDEDMGARVCHGRWAVQEQPVDGLIPDGATLETHEHLYLTDGDTRVLAAVDGLPAIAAHTFGKGRGVYMAGFAYSPVNARMLLNLLLCGAVVLPGVQSRNLSVSLPLSPGRLLASCAGVYAVLRALLYCFGRSGAPSVPATLEVAGVQLPVQAFHDTGFALQEPLSGKAVVLVQYPAVRHRLPQAARQYLDGWFAHSTAPPPPELGVHLVPCRSIHGQSMLPALPAALQLGKDRAGGLLAAFCCPTPPDPAWELLYGEDAAQLLL